MTVQTYGVKVGGALSCLSIGDYKPTKVDTVEGFFLDEMIVSLKNPRRYQTLS